MTKPTSAADVRPDIGRPDAFVSYSRADSAFVRRLHATLEVGGKDLWIDWEDIQPSADWEGRVHAAIEAARAVVVVLSPDAVRSRSCKDEVAHAVGAAKRLIPIVRRDVRPEDAGEALARPNWIWLREEDDFEAGCAALVAALESDFEWRDAHARITTRTVEWQTADRDTSLLLRGSDLQKAEEWAAVQSDHREHVTREQAEFILASRRATGRRQRRTLTSVTFALVVAVALAAFALVQRQTAIDREHKAQSRQFAAEGIAALDRDPPRALSVAARGLRAAQTTEAVDAMRAALMSPRPTAVVTGTVSPDGRRALRTRQRGPAQIVDVGSDRTLGRLGGRIDALGPAEFSPNGRHLAAVVRAGADWTLRLWPSAQGSRSDRVLSRGTQHSDVATGSPTFSADGRRLAIGDDQIGVRVWELQTGRLLRRIPDASDPALDADGGRVVAASDSTITVTDVATGATLARLKLADIVHQLEFSDDGRRVLTTLLGGDTGRSATVGYVWSWATASRAIEVGPHALWVNQVDVSPDGRYAVTAGEDRRARVWNLKSRTSVALIGHNRAVRSAAFSPDGRLVVTGGEDASARVWDPRTGRTLAELRGHAGAVEADFATDGRIVTRGGGDGSARIWDLGLRNLPVAADAAVFGLSEVGVLGAAFSPDGKQIVTAGGDQRAVVWDTATGRRIRAITIAPPSSYDGSQDTAARFSADGRTLLLSTADGPSRMVDVASRRSRVERYGSSTADLGAWWFPPVFDPAGRVVVTARSRGEPARLLDARSGRLIGALPGSGGVEVPAFSGDGRRLATVDSPDQRRAATIVRILAVPSLRVEAVLRPAGTRSVVGGVSLSPDGRLALIFGLDRAELWDVAARRRRAQLTGHAGGANGAAFSADGRFTATAGTDGTARVWDTADGHLVAILAGHADDVTAVAFSPDGRRVVTTSRDGSALIRDCPACRTADQLAALAANG